MEKLKNYGKIISGKYTGREGYFSDVNEYGLVRFFPKEGEYPYQVNLKREMVELIRKEP